MQSHDPRPSSRDDLGWRYFSSREVRDALAWAEAGGIAVHENIYPSRGRRTAHLLGPDETRLIAAARSIGCRSGWIQRTRTLHFDLVEAPLRAGLRRCGVDPSVSPALLKRRAGAGGGGQRRADESEGDEHGGGSEGGGGSSSATSSPS